MKSTAYNSGMLDYFFGPLDSSFTAKLSQLIQQNHSVRWIAFRHDGGSFQQSPGSKCWVIVTDQAPYYHGVPPGCAAKLQEFFVLGHGILCVAFMTPAPASPAGAWSITTDKGFFNSPSVPLDCHQKMMEIYGDGRRVLCVAFTGPGISSADANHWSIITDDGFFNQEDMFHQPLIPFACHNRMEELTDQGHKLRVVAFSQSEFWGDSVFSIITDKGFYNTEVTPGWVINERMLAFGECGWTVRTLAFAPQWALDYGGWGFSLIGDVPAPKPSRRRLPLVNVTGTGAIPAGPTDPQLPVRYDVTLTVTNLASSSITLDMLLYLTSTGGWIYRTWNPFQPGGIFGGQPNQLAPGAVLTAPGMDRAEAELGPVVIRTSAQAGSEPPLISHAQLAILRAGYLAPPDVQADPPLFIGLLTNPAEAVMLWRSQDSETPAPWLKLKGHLVNTSFDPAFVTDVSVEIKTGSTIIWTASAPAYTWTFYTYTAGPPVAYKPITTIEKGGVVVPPGVADFVAGISLPSDFVAGTLSVTLAYRHEGRCRQAVWIGPLTLASPVQLRSPVAGTWRWGNGPDSNSLTVHAVPGERFAYDILIEQDGQTYKGEKQKDPPSDKSRYYAWDQPFLCAADGVVYAVEDSFADHDAFLASPPKGTNFIVVKHGLNLYSWYLHLKQDSIATSSVTKKKLAPGDSVNAGQVLAHVGNTGNSSDPHLHFMVGEVDGTGRLHMLPFQIDKLRTEHNQTVTAVPGTGIYVS